MIQPNIYNHSKKQYMKKLKPFIPLITIVSIFLALLFFGAYIMSPGAFANLQEYAFKDVTSPDIIDKITDLKKNNPQYIVWSKDENGNIFNPDGKREPIRNFYTYYFLLPFEDRTVIVKIYIDGSEADKSRILLGGYTFAEDIYRGWGDPRYEKEERKVTTVLEKEVLDNLGFNYRKLWF